VATLHSSLCPKFLQSDQVKMIDAEFEAYLLLSSRVDSCSPWRYPNVRQCKIWNDLHFRVYLVPRVVRFLRLDSRPRPDAIGEATKMRRARVRQAVTHPKVYAEHVDCNPRTRVWGVSSRV
jgi:hypothetical protein